MRYLLPSGLPVEARFLPTPAAVFVVLWWVLCFSALVSPVAAQNNTLTIREKAGVTTTNYPIQLARPFVAGEIANFPRALINGTAITTQANVKARWPDGSVKHAILSFYIPTLAANSTITVSFANQTTGNDATALTKREMQHRNYNFDARIELNNGGRTQSASAAEMLQADDYSYWTQGNVSTSIILADHSLERPFDLGFDANRSFRPIFHATFWPTAKKVRVRYIGEVSNTVALQDQNYNLTLKLQNKPAQTVYSKAGITHISAGRWTKEFWIGGAPSKIEINHNLAYLKRTMAVPNYDTSRVISEATLQNAYAGSIDSWLNAPRGVFDQGNLYKAMPTAGGRQEIGPYPTWLIRWLYTGDARAFEQSVGNAELSAAFPIHFREGLGTRLFDRNSNTAALGRVLSSSARPSVFLHRGNAYINYAYTSPADKIVPVGAMTDGGWLPDCAHQPDYHSPLYLLTGDYFFLEEMNFWASWSAVSSNYTNVYWWGRGPDGGDTGGIMDEVRGDGWILRSRAQAAFLNPDGSPEKAYFTRLTNDAIAIWEGMVGISGSPLQGTSNYNWGATIARKKFSDRATHPITPPLLGFWEEGHPVYSWSEIVDPGKATMETSPWMHFFLVYGLGRAKELGFPTNRLLTWASQVVIKPLIDPAYNPYLNTAYQMPTVKNTVDNAYVSDWSETKASYLPNFDPLPAFQEHLMLPEHGYPFIMMTAVALTRQEMGGNAAWAFVQTNVQPAPVLNDNPKWAILPR